VASSISGCGVCTECRVMCAYTALSIHTTAWNTCCHNTANHITMYFYWSVKKIVALARLSISSLRMVQVDRNM